MALDTVYNHTAEGDHRGLSLAAEDSPGKLVRGKLGRVGGHKSEKGGAEMNSYDFVMLYSASLRDAHINGRHAC